MLTTTKIIEQQCPLCHKANACAVSMGKGIEECWCNTENISKSRLDSIAKPEIFKRCLCRACSKETGEPDRGR